MSYKYKLLWSDCKDTPAFRASIEYIYTQYPLWRDSHAEVIDYNQHGEMMAFGLIDRAPDYWTISPDHVGVIIDIYYSQFSDTWNRIGDAFHDFRAGWNKNEEAHQILRDWDEAKKFNRLINKWRKVDLRIVNIDMPWIPTTQSIVDELEERYPELRVVSFETLTRLKLQFICDAPTLIYIVRDIEYMYQWKLASKLPQEPKMEA